MEQESVTLIVGLVSLLLGAVLGGGTAMVVVARVFERAKNDPNAIALGEKLYNSVPLPIVQQLLRDAAVYAVKVTDGVPEAEKGPTTLTITDSMGATSSVTQWTQPSTPTTEAVG